MAKYSEVSSSTEVNASAPCSAEFGLKATFPDDKGQTYPAKEIPYRARTPQGVVEGSLDGNGEVIMSDVGIGSVTIEVLPDVDKEIENLRKSIKQALDATIAEERKEGEALKNTYDKLDTTDKVLVSTGAVLQGGWNILEGMGEALASVAHEAGEYILDPLNAPETFREDVEAVKTKYNSLKTASKEALDAYHTLKDDVQTWQMFEKFASDFYDAQHHTELTEGGSEAVLGIILTIVTAGAGAAVAGTRIASLAVKIAPKIKDIIKAIKKRKWFKKKKTIRANKKAEVEKEIIRDDFLKDPSVPKEVYRGDSRDQNTIFEEGLKSKAPNSDTSLKEYANTNKPSKYVGTSKDKNIAEGFATDRGQKDGYLYTIDTDNISGIDVNDALKNDSPFPFEKEIVYPEGIPIENIKGVTPIMKDGSYGDYSTLNPNYKK